MEDKKMEELLQKLRRADDICKEANVYYENANHIEQETMNQKAIQKKALIKWVIIGVVSYYIGGVVVGGIARVIMRLPVIGNLLALVLLVGMTAAVIYVCATGYQKEKVSITNKMRDIHNNAEEERAKAERVFEQHADELAFLPVDYWYPMATDFMVKAVQTQRATTLAEVIDKFEEQLHRWKIEQANSQMLELQKQQTAHLASIKTSSKISAAANVTNTLFNIASKL